MRKIGIIATAAALALGSVAATTGAEARPYGFHGGYGHGYGHGYGYRGGRRGIGTGGAVAAGAANNYYNRGGYGPTYGAPAYGYGAPAYGGYYGAPY
ncbi:MAG: hypothetical protein EOO66_33725 [Methylobacterium sp.]|nr:MAG: hypothetical protein EOO66_33725 [Methylobacterium sp.]